MLLGGGRYSGGKIGKKTRQAGLQEPLWSNVKA